MQKLNHDINREKQLYFKDWIGKKIILLKLGKMCDEVIFKKDFS
jgi:hypothetical protein